MPYSLALLDPVTALSGAADQLVQRRRQDQNPIIVVFVVAIAVLLAISAIMSIATMIYCLHKGGTFTWSSSNGWKFWEMKVACKLH